LLFTGLGLAAGGEQGGSGLLLLAITSATAVEEATTSFDFCAIALPGSVGPAPAIAARSAGEGAEEAAIFFDCCAIVLPGSAGGAVDARGGGRGGELSPHALRAFVNISVDTSAIMLKLFFLWDIFGGFLRGGSEEPG